MPRALYRNSVFLNVPFDKNYRPIFRAIIFAVFDCGFVARSALETDDSGAVRIQTIHELIEKSKYGVHDISRTSLDSEHRLPRFNMPFELGIFLGAKTHGRKRHREKHTLILDCERYRYQIFCSDIAGQSVRAHKRQPEGAIRCIRNWLRTSPDTAGTILPGGEFICTRYQAFLQQLPLLRKKFNLDQRGFNFNDYTSLVVGWLKANPR